MRVGIGAVLGTTGGPVRYAQELVAALGQVAGGEEYVVFTNRPALFAKAAVETVRVPLPAAALEPLWDHVLLPAAVRRRGIDVYHGIKGALPLSMDVPCAVTIHDLAVYACPETFAWRQHLHMRPHLRLAARRARRIVADSEHARADIVRRLRVPEARVVAVPLGVRADLFSPVAEPGDEAGAARLGLPPRFLLYAGTIQPRKNVGRVVAAFRDLGAAPEWQLLLVGRRRPDYQAEWLSAPPAGVRYLGTVADADLAIIYRRAAVLISPSSYEGFGLTLLEAMASGCPVVAARNTSVPEVVGDAGVLLDSVEVPAIRAAMAGLIQDEAMRADLGRRGRQRAERLTWVHTARQMQKLYEEIRAAD